MTGDAWVAVGLAMFFGIGVGFMWSDCSRQRELRAMRQYRREVRELRDRRGQSGANDGEPPKLRLVIGGGIR